MEMSSVVGVAITLIVGLGGGAGLFKLYTARATSKNIDALSGKVGVEATALFSESVLSMLREADDNAKEARLEAAEARREASAARQEAVWSHRATDLALEELAQLRRWIIQQGLTPPDSNQFDRTGHRIERKYIYGHSEEDSTKPEE